MRRIERGARKPSPEQIAQLADTLQVPVADLGFTTATVDESAAATPGKGKAAKVVAVGKRTGKGIATTKDFKDEVGAVLAS